jgi:hypothetical protein
MTLEEMAECRIDPQHIRMESPLCLKEFEYLYERVRIRFALRKSHIEWRERDTYRDFVAQVETAG